MALAVMVDLVAVAPGPPPVEHLSKLVAGKEMLAVHRPASRVQVVVVPEVQAPIKRAQIQVRPLVVRGALVYLILYRVHLFHTETAEMAVIERIVQMVQIQFKIEETVAEVAVRTQLVRVHLAALVVLEWSSYLIRQSSIQCQHTSRVSMARRSISITRYHHLAPIQIAT
jgi:hypothetical protein